MQRSAFRVFDCVARGSLAFVNFCFAHSPILQYSSTPMLPHSSTALLKCSNTPILQYFHNAPHPTRECAAISFLTIRPDYTNVPILQYSPVRQYFNAPQKTIPCTRILHTQKLAIILKYSCPNTQYPQSSRSYPRTCSDQLSGCSTASVEAP